MAQPRYRYLVADLLTDVVYGQPTLVDVAFDRRISRTGTFQATMPVVNAAHAKLANQITDWVGRTTLWVIRGQQLWWGGVVWLTGPSRDGSDSKMEIQAATFESFAFHREIRGNIPAGTGLVYNDVDLGVVMPDLWRTLQGGDGSTSNIGLEANNNPIGVVKSFEWTRPMVTKYEEAIEAIGDLPDGPEHTIDVFFTAGGSRHKQFRTGSPYLGSSAPKLLIPGNSIPSWSKTKDATTGGTSFQVRGASVLVNKVSTPLMSNVYEDVEKLNHGWPRLDHTSDHTQMKVLEKINNVAQADRDRERNARVVPQVSANIEGTGWHPNHLGDAVTVQYGRNDLFNPGVRETIRPVAVTITPPTDSGREVIQFATADTVDG